MILSYHECCETLEKRRRNALRHGPRNAIATHAAYDESEIGRKEAAMFAPYLQQHQLYALTGTEGQANRQQATKQALQMFQRARFWGQVRRGWAQLTGASSSLLSLCDVERSCTIRGRAHVGTRSVPLKQIQGSEGRCRDFDADFNPLLAHDRGRWVGVATAWEIEGELPPVQLIQVGELYFVRDGHHRISVARQRGQSAIDAEVTVWQVEGPLPWKRPRPLRRAAFQQVA